VSLFVLLLCFWSLYLCSTSCLDTASYFHTIIFCLCVVVSCLCVIVSCRWLLLFAFDYYFLFSCHNCFLPSSYCYLPSCHYFLISINDVCFCVVTSFPIATTCLHTLVMQYCVNICSFLLLLCFSLCCYFLFLLVLLLHLPFMLFKFLLLFFFCIF